jgi:NAD(P)-dependent dehydrogenase (short-subunit alcohol dehydrogenase family)
MSKLSGKIALITGGTSGIGLATAQRFVNEGAYVFITGRDQSRIDEAIKKIGSNVTGVQGDVANLKRSRPSHRADSERKRQARHRLR